MLLGLGPSEHSHDPLCYENTVIESNNYVKERANTTTDCPAQIITDSVVNTEENIRLYLPSKEAQKQKINRSRRNSGINEPRSLINIQIPTEMMFVDDELFVLHEENFNEKKNIILSTKSSLQILSLSECWVMDGTFYVVPEIFTQLFTIHGKVGMEIIPLVFCLMSSKNKESYYQLFFNLLRISCNYGINLNPKIIISDFEKIIPTTVKMFFPEVITKGCLFHLGQIIWRRTQKNNLVVKYSKHKGFIYFFSFNNI